MTQAQATKQYPAGSYYVGDLCYFTAIDWNEFCAKTISGSNCLEGDFVVSGRETWHHGTAYGDGLYDSSLGFSFPVDAGLIGICKLEHGDEVPDGGRLVEFLAPFTPRYENGTFYIGHLEIGTGDSALYEEEGEE